MVEYCKLGNQPLVFALAEFRFSPVAQIEKFFPDMQEALRREYPLEEMSVEQIMHVQDGTVSLTTVPRRGYFSADRDRVVLLDQNRMIYSTTAYPRFEGFSAACRSLVETLQRVVQPALILRIGLRYGDCIRIGPTESLQTYVDPCFGYPPQALSLGKPQFQREEIGIQTDIGNLMIRSLYGVHPLRCLPDLQGIPGMPVPDTEASHRIVLDFDHGWAPAPKPEAFGADRLLDVLSQLHTTAREAFWSLTSESAKKNQWA